jgi:hypothetical protein
MMDEGLVSVLLLRAIYFYEREAIKTTEPNEVASQEDYVASLRDDYIYRRQGYLERRRHERTAAALAAAEAEVARLRAALVTTFGYANYMTRYYGINPHMLSGSFSDDLRNLMSIIGTALNPEATHENG